MATETKTESTNWADDLLDRRQYADFLTTYVERKCEIGAPGLVVALDAPWGLGKTFFTTRWAKDLVEGKRAVVRFDAWENDSAGDAAISFMAELRQAVTPLYAHLPAGDALQVKLTEQSKGLVKSLRKATVPALAVVGKALLKKATGIGFDDLADAVTEGEVEEQLEALAEEAPEAIEKGLDAFFEKALQAHSERLKSVAAFRQSLETLIETLRNEKLMEGPLYIFIDELDRCRPDYALKLLEGVKHLFSVKGVAFIVSTNLRQLSKSVGAVYGTTFDGYSYLKRFFEFEYRLPEPTRRAFIAAQLQGTSMQAFPGLSGFDPSLQGNDDSAAHVLAAVGDAFHLDLRSLQRVLVIADAAVAGRPANYGFVALWLFFLAALRHVNPEEFFKVLNRSYDGTEFVQMCKRVLTGPTEIVAVQRTDRGPTGQRVAVSMLGALGKFYEITTSVDSSLKNQVERDEWTTPYPEVVIFVVTNLYNYLPGRQPHPLRMHAELIAAAGHSAKR